MPVFGYHCDNCDSEFEKLLKRWDDEDPNCIHCEVKLRRLPSAPHAINVMPLSYYGTGSSFNTQYDSHKVWEKNTPDGVPRQITINSRQEQIAYCKREGLVDPHEAPSDPGIDEKGHAVTTRGTKGQWI